jgi:hypothetical protein
MPTANRNSILRWATALLLQGCLVPTGEKWATAGGGGPPYVPRPEYIFRFPAEQDTLTAGTAAHAAWIHNGHLADPIELSLWRDSLSAADNLGSADPDEGSLAFKLPWGLPSGRYRLRLRASGHPGASVFSAAFSIQAPAPDPYEPDDRLDLAKPIGADAVPRRRNFTTPEDTDWIRFDAEPGKRYVAALRAKLRVHLDLIDSAGRMLQGQTGNSLLIGLSPPYAGRFYLRAFPDADPYPAPDDRGYRISVAGFGPSDAPYAIAFSAPGTGTTWEIGTVQTLSWVPDTLEFGTQVVLDLYKGDAMKSVTVTAANTGACSFPFPPGLPPGDDYRILMAPAQDYGYRSVFAFAYSPFFALGPAGDTARSGP